MDQNSIKLNKDGTPKKKKGGRMPGAGRPKGSTEQITIAGLLASLKDRANGKNYEELLVDDFMQARAMGDKNLTIKYHHLILNKVMIAQARIEVVDSEDTIEAKKVAFADALAKLTGLNKE